MTPSVTSTTTGQHQGTCSIDGCETPRKSLGLCEKHYYRLRRNGTTNLLPPKSQSAEFIARTERMKLMYESGMSTTSVGLHLGLDASYVAQLLRRAGVTMRPFGAAGKQHPAWQGDEVNYSGAHMRVRSSRGSASHLQCECGARAKQWSYNHQDPDEKQSELGPYSTNPDYYVAMCVSCHKRFDLAWIAGEL